MKKKSIIIVCFILIVVGLVVWLLTRSHLLGNMKHTCTETETSSSAISFSGE